MQYLIQIPQTPTTPPTPPTMPTSLSYEMMLYIVMCSLFSAPVLTKLIDALLSIYKDWGQSLEHASLQYKEMDTILKDARNSLNCQRVAVVRASNGGEIPKVTKPIYITVLGENYKDGSSELAMYWNARKADINHIRVLSSLFNSTYIVADGSDEWEHLLATYAQHDTKELIFVPIHHNRKEFFYLMVFYGEEVVDEQQVAIAKDFASVLATKVIKK